MRCRGLLPTSIASKNSTHERASHPEMDTETETGLTAPGKKQLALAFWLHVPDWVTGEAKPEPRGWVVPQLPIHRLQTTNVYYFRLTWKGKEPASKHHHTAAGCSPLGTLQGTVMFLAKAGGRRPSEVLDLATSRVCDVWSAFNIHLSYLFVSFCAGGRTQSLKHAFPTQLAQQSPNYMFQFQYSATAVFITQKV